jgi:adenosylcobinamide kinase/adenosylcobinamide-phosphate guanylyltransferase
MMKSITLITGGARSGKSSFALDLARKNYERRVFIATAVAFDEEMKRRIVQHQKERGNLFHTLEEPVHLTETLSAVPPGTEVALVDCLTVWIGNLYHHCREGEEAVRNYLDRFIKVISQVSYDLILVTNEVGWGIVPENPLARSFRDTAGYLNQKVAERADHVYLLCCGIPLEVKRRNERDIPAS